MTPVAVPVVGEDLSTRPAERWVYVGPLWVDSRRCEACQQWFACESRHPYTRCRACDRGGPTLTPEGLEAVRAVVAAHHAYRLACGLGGKLSGGQAAHDGGAPSRGECEEKMRTAAEEWWVQAETLYDELTRLFPAASANTRGRARCHDES